MNGLNLSNIQDAKLGSTQVSALYYGSTKIWESTPDYPEYLTITSLDDNNKIYWNLSDANAFVYTITYSTDYINWSAPIAPTTGGTLITTLNTNQKLYIRANMGIQTTSYYNFFSSTGRFNLSGSTYWLSNTPGTCADYIYKGLFYGCTGLQDASQLLLAETTLAEGCYESMFKGCLFLDAAPVLPATTLATSCYRSMFQNCSQLTAAPVLPATTLAEGCYRAMFQACTWLSNPPALPATTLALECYREMFKGCTNMTSVPALPATTLAAGCYRAMFSSCNNILSAPDLPATKLVTYCYYYMFENCYKLEYIKCYATNISASNSHAYWVKGVTTNQQTGNFYKPASMTSWATNSTSGIPTGWTVVNI